MSLVATGIGAVIASIAAKVGASLVKDAVGGKLGGIAGDLAGVVIDKVAEKIGLPVERIEQADPKALETAVAAVEAEMPDLILAWVEQQREQNRLMLAEMEKSEHWFTWAWRPVGMWTFNTLVVWYVAIVPIINFFAAAAGWSARLELIVEVSSFVALYMFFCGFYMGGHNVKDAVAKITAAFGRNRP